MVPLQGNGRTRPGNHYQCYKYKGMASSGGEDVGVVFLF